MCPPCKSKTGYVSEKRFINVRTVLAVLIKQNVSKGTTAKRLWKKGQKLFRLQNILEQRKEDLERILSEEGILFRTNRSIQAEGSFGDLKQDMQFRRYLSKGTSNVLAESTLLAMAKHK